MKMQIMGKKITKNQIKFKLKIFVFIDIWFVKQDIQKWLKKDVQFLSSPIACVACEKTELLETEIGVDKMGWFIKQDIRKLLKTKLCSF